MQRSRPGGIEPSVGQGTDGQNPPENGAPGQRPHPSSLPVERKWSIREPHDQKEPYRWKNV